MAGNNEEAMEAIAEALALDPDQGPAWINQVAEIGQQHDGVLSLIPALTSPSEPPGPSSPEDDTDVSR